MLRDLTPIHHALALAQTRNFARAAEVVNITQPALSRSIATLERILGVKLFDRLRSGVELTAFGKLLTERGSQLISDIESIQRDIHLLVGLHTGSLSVATGAWAGESLIGQVAARLLAKHPGLNISMMTLDAQDVISGVMSASFDVGIASSAKVGMEPKLVVTALPPAAIYFVCRQGHPLAGQRRITLEKLVRYPIVSGSMGGEIAEFAKANGALGQLNKDAGEFNPKIQVNSLGLALGVVANSDAVLPAILAMVQEEIRIGHLVMLDVAMSPISIRQSMFYRDGRTPSPAASAFMDLLLEAETSTG